MKLGNSGAALLRPPNVTTIKFFTLLIMLALLLVIPAGSALAQGGEDVSAAFTNIVTTVTDIIQSLTVVVGILGITFWGFGKVARPVFPEISQLTNQYISGFLVGIVAVFVAATVVEALAEAIGSSAG
jgi:hypothetical protein